MGAVKEGKFTILSLMGRSSTYVTLCTLSQWRLMVHIFSYQAFSFLTRLYQIHNPAVARIGCTFIYPRRP